MSPALDHSEQNTLMACVAFVILGYGTWRGMPDIAVTLLYFVVLLFAVVHVGRAVRGAWREVQGEPASAVAPDTQSKKFVI